MPCRGQRCSLMPRWRAVACQPLRWAGPVGQGLVLVLVTFGLVLPLACHRLLYSYYFIRSMYLDAMSQDVLQESYSRGQEALRFWQDSHPSTHLSIATGSELLVTVVTARRTEGRDFHYLLQVMQQLSSLLSGCRGRGGGAGEEGHRCAQVLVCDVESGPQDHEDARLLEGRFPVVRRPPEERRRRGRGGSEVNTFEREKRDYVFCLRRGWQLARPRNVLVLEDDALPRPDLFPVVTDLLGRAAARRTLYMKLYHPERLQRYWNPEPWRLLEWLGLGLVAASSLLLLLPHLLPLSSSFSLSAPHLLFFTLYFMVAVEMAGRHYLLELRRVSPQLYAVAPATECCTPAMLYPGNASLRAAEYLDGSFCVKGNAKDTVLYHMARSVPGERAHSVEPNLVSHIGAFSSVRTNPPRPKLL